MAKPTVTVSLNEDDFYFLTNSMGLNVSDEDEMNPDERKTTRKIWRANDRLQDKINTHNREGQGDD